MIKSNPIKTCIGEKKERNPHKTKDFDALFNRGFY